MSIEQYSQEYSSREDMTGELDGPDFTDGFSESIEIAHQNKRSKPSKPEPQTTVDTQQNSQIKTTHQYKVNDQEDVEDIVRKYASLFREFVQDDPFAMPILGLVGLILLLGGIFLVMV